MSPPMGAARAGIAGAKVSAIPDSVVTQYQFEDGGDTTTAVDSVGSNDANISGASYDSDAQCGSNSLLFDDANSDSVISQSAVDLVTTGTADEISVAAFFQTDTTGVQYVAGYQPTGDNDNHVYLQLLDDGSIRFFLQVGGANVQPSGGSYSTGTWHHAAVVVDDQEVRGYLDGTQVVSESHSLTPSNIGSGLLISGLRESNDGSPFSGRTDNVTFADGALAESEVVELKDSCGLAGSWRLSKTSVDSLSDVDGLTLADIDGDGSQDMVVGDGVNGNGYWYEQGGDPDTWTQHSIYSGGTEIEGTGVGDVDGDGQMEVAFADQGANEIVLAKQDTSDPTGSWSSVTLDSSATNPQTVRFFDIDGDGNPEPVYCCEGSSSSSPGGVFWQEFSGGDPMDTANWSEHLINEIAGAYWLTYERKDLTDDGDADNLLATARGDGSDYRDGGIHILDPPADPTNSWSATSFDTGTHHAYATHMDVTGDGDTRDLVTAYNDAADNVYLSEWSGGSYTVNGWGQSTGDAYNSAFAGPWSDGDPWGLFMYNDPQNRLELWVHDGTDWTMRSSVSANKAQGDMYRHDFDGDGSPDVACFASNTNELMWVRVAPP